MIAVGLYFYSLNTNKNKQVASVSTINHPFGLSNTCRAVPKFIPSLKMQSASLDSKQEDGSMGLQIRDIATKGKIWQHKSWTASGYIAAFDRDEFGNIYVTPMPYVSLLKNPPKLQNQIYKID